MEDNENHPTANYKLFLKDEAKLLYNSVFQGIAPQSIIDAYINANLKLIPDPGPDFRKLIEAGTDIEALELAWRFRSPRNILTRKVHILVYLVEATPEHYNHFFNSKKRFFYTLILLGYHGVRSVIKLPKGMFLLKRYHLV